MNHRIAWAALLALLAPATGAETCMECPGKVWYVDARAQGASDGRSWATAYRRLQPAIKAASAGDCVWVAAGRYFTHTGTNRNSTFLVDRRLNIYGGFDGTELCFASRAGLFAQTRLSGEIGDPTTRTDNAYIVVTVSGEQPIGEMLKVVIDGFSIRDGYNDFSTRMGGGIRVELASLVLRNATVRDNLASYGAGLHAGGSNIDIVNSSFIANDARKDGGALCFISVRSEMEPGLGPNIYNSRFRRNHSKQRGGAFFFDEFREGAEADFVSCLFRGNSSEEGGVGYLIDEPSLAFHPGRASMTGCTFSANQASRGSVFVAEDTGLIQPAELYLQSSIIWGNVGSVPPAGDEIVGSVLSVTLDTTIVEQGSKWDCNPLPDCANSPTCTTFDCNPLFGANFVPVSGSPAIDSGSPWFPPDIFDLDLDGDTVEPASLDLDGNPRNQGVDPDRGAYEVE